MTIYCFDLDGTLCTSVSNSRYEEAQPLYNVINQVNNLYNTGNTVNIFTARGSVSGKDWTDFTQKQLKQWGILYHELIMNQKPHFDLLVDDKVMHIDEWKKQQGIDRKIGFVASSFDLIHPGYVLMFKDAKTVCNYLICAIQTDPTIDRPGIKSKPVQTLEERIMILESIKYVDEVVVYETEQDLVKLLQKIKPDIRILGTDYIGKSYTGQELNIPIHWSKREHNWSTTALKNRVWEAENKKRFSGK